MEYRYEPLENHADAYANYAAFLVEVFDKPALFTTEYLLWQYGQNPVGQAVGYNAWYGEQLVGHCATLPVEYMFNDQPVKGVLCLNVATHPAHQGKGLFTRLLSETFNLAARLNYEFCIAVPNANSTPAFVRKHNFALLTQLQVFLGIGHIDTNRQSASFYEHRTPDFLNWRLARPNAQYSMSLKSKQAAIYANTGWPGIQAQLCNYDLPPKGLPKLPAKGVQLATLWIGYNQQVTKKGIFAPLPERFKPSPLNLVIKGLQTAFKIPKLTQIDFSLIDFDPY
ncbi:MAG TPA: GNAT family N-acetyltransferase [Phnomibacter sp.]|nr:GNAT family N-acetyltransferase [Phnomibacter sp.]